MIKNIDIQYIGAENICLSLFHIFICSMILSKLGSNFRVTTPQQKNSENSGKYLKAAGSTHTVFTREGNKIENNIMKNVKGRVHRKSTYVNAFGEEIRCKLGKPLICSLKCSILTVSFMGDIALPEQIQRSICLVSGPDRCTNARQFTFSSAQQ